MINPHQCFGQKTPVALQTAAEHLRTQVVILNSSATYKERNSTVLLHVALVLTPLLEPRKHSTGCNTERSADQLLGALRWPTHRAGGSSAHSSLFTITHRSDARFLCGETCHSIKSLLRYLSELRQTWKVSPSTPTLCRNGPKKLACAGPEAARDTHAAEPRGSTRTMSCWTGPQKKQLLITAFCFLLPPPPPPGPAF